MDTNLTVCLQAVHAADVGVRDAANMYIEADMRRSQEEHIIKTSQVQRVKRLQQCAEDICVHAQMLTINNVHTGDFEHLTSKLLRRIYQSHEKSDRDEVELDYLNERCVKCRKELWSRQLQLEFARGSLSNAIH